jgi:phospholipid/cholesterol/gamma-HCH transport system substrate-binding protein
MDDTTRTSRKVGLFVVIALAIIGGLILNFSKGASVFRPSYTITVQAENVGGLVSGAGVMMAGVPIGSVRSMDLSPDGKVVLIRCKILKRYPIHSDARFGIEQSGFLGDQFISITPTDNVGKVLVNNAVVRAESPFNLQDAARSAVGLVKKLDSAATRIDSAILRVEKEILSDETLANLKSVFANAKRLTEQAESTLTEVQSLVQTSRPTLERTLASAQRFSGRLDTLGSQLLTVRTNLSSLISNVDSLVVSNRTSIQGSLENIEVASKDLRELLSHLNSGRGVAGGLLKDEQLRRQIDQLVENLTLLSANLNRYGLLYKPKQTVPITRDVPNPGRTPFR